MADNFEAVPDSWSVLMFDIIGSTKAIARGGYKQVNMVGAMCVVSALRFFNRNDIPFVFGGDGATLLIPTDLIEDYKIAVRAVMERSRQEFGLDIRVGYVSVSEIRKLGSDVLLRKEPVARSFARSDLLGGGLDLAESLIKANKSPAQMIESVDHDSANKLDLDGLECRWEPIRSSRGVFLSVIVKPRDWRPEKAEPIFQSVLDLLGPLMKIDPQQLKVTMNPMGVVDEIRAHGGGMLSAWDFIKKITWTWIKTLYGRYAMANKVSRAGVLWGNYQAEAVKNTDAIKIDDALRFVVDLPFEAADRLEAFLSQLEKDRKIHFAFHKSTTAQLTCFVSTHKDDHIHFIDGGSGGYSSAAKILKAKIAADEALWNLKGNQRAAS